MSDPPASYGDAFAAFFTEVAKGMATKYEATSFFAIVVSWIAGPPNFVTVQRIGSPIVEGPYRVATHIIALAAGDRVHVVDVTGEGGFAIPFHLPILTTETQLPPAPTPPPEGVILVGSSNVESGPITSTVPVDVVTISGLTIPTSKYVGIDLQYRKTAGFATSAALGLAINGVEIQSPVQATGATNAVDAGLYQGKLGPREAGYLTGSFFLMTAVGNVTGPFTNNAMPAAIINSIAIRGLVGNAAIQLFVKNVRIYTYP